MVPLTFYGVFTVGGSEKVLYKNQKKKLPRKAYRGSYDVGSCNPTYLECILNLLQLLERDAFFNLKKLIGSQLSGHNF